MSGARRSGRRGRSACGAALGALALAWLAGCAAAGIPREALPPESIAFRYRTAEEAEKLAALRERIRRAAQPRNDPRKQNMIDLNQVGEVVGIGPDQEERAAANLGKVALVHPHEGEVEVMDWAPRGTRPLAWSPDHRRLLYLMLQRGVAQIYEYDLDAKRLKAITVGTRPHFAASYGPDGKIAFSRYTPLSREGGGIRIFVRDPETGRARPVTPGPADSKPSMAPDGRFVIFEQRDEKGRARIARLDLGPDLEPQGEVRVIGMGQDPEITPDGQWVVYAAPLDGRLRIWRMRPDGSGKQRIGPHIVDKDEMDPSVSPDGRFVVFVSKEWDLKRLVVRPITGGPTWPLTREGEGLEPVW